MEQENHNNDEYYDQEQMQQAYKYLCTFPPGYRFDPRDHELIVNYLQAMINREHLPVHMMHSVNIYDYNPEELTAKYMPQGDKMWYFFTPRERKYPKGDRPNRKAGDGYWKATGADKAIRNNRGTIIGYRKALVFYQGKPQKGRKMTWIMHEFKVKGPESPKGKGKETCKDRLITSMRLDDVVLCRIYKKVEGKAKEGGQQAEKQVQKEPETSSVDSVVPSDDSGEDHLALEVDDYNYSDQFLNVYGPSTSWNYQNYNLFQSQPMEGNGSFLYGDHFATGSDGIFSDINPNQYTLGDPKIETTRVQSPGGIYDELLARKYNPKIETTMQSPGRIDDEMLARKYDLFAEEDVTPSSVSTLLPKVEDCGPSDTSTYFEQQQQPPH